MSRIADGKVVSFHYVLRDDAGEILDESPEDEPMLYLHGADNIVEGLERALAGCASGDHLDVVVEPRDGYGELVPDGSRMLPLQAFPPDAELEEGFELVLETPDGVPQPMWVVAVEGDGVRCDVNHPLAGVRLHFTVDVGEVRDATADELEHGHPHGPGDEHDHG